MPTSFTKLKSGSWGVRTSEKHAPGASCTVTKRDGSTSTVTIGREIWTDDKVWLYATMNDSIRQPRNKRSTRTGCYCGSVEEYEKRTDCAQCRHDRY